ncbi:VanW family protein [Bacillus sp. FJAT-49711]|uniref:VanW family protein n=1 Tax=Bacillus sp. FJAT-49711 TaxID=2833585 RepID=UPI001BCA307D|nr:VanW family protein [Bacillus sp. FJAT-49711]MBS4216995.1 VanW family protein [Bacillus sp. FJAT-49711]
MAIGKTKVIFLLLLISCLIIGCSRFNDNISNNPQASTKEPKEEEVISDNELTNNEFMISEVNREFQNTPRFQLLLDSLQNVEIKGKSQFSILQHIEKANLSSVESENMSEVASILYELIIQSNLIVMERNISNTFNDEFILGLEAKVDPQSKLDFSFYNPNEEPIHIEWKQSKGSLNAILFGSIQKEQYRIRFEEEKSYKPRIIKQYSPAITNNDFQVKEKGNDGKSITVIKEKMDVNGRVVDKEVVAEDFYLPVHKIEIHRLLKASEKNIDEEGSLEQDNNQVEQVNDEDNNELDQNEQVKEKDSNEMKQNETETNDIIWTDPGDISK